MRPLSWLGRVALIVAAIGAINWGLVALFDFNLVEEIFGTGTATDVVYVIVGIAGVIALFEFIDMVRAGSLSGGARAASIVGSIALLLTSVGAINWGLIGLFDFNLVEEISTDTAWTDTVYTIVGISGVLVLAVAFGLWAALGRDSRRRGEVTSFDREHDRDDDIRRAA